MSPVTFPRGRRAPQYESQVGTLAFALTRAIAEHGAPNRFGCKELASYGGPSPLITGQILRNAEQMARVQAVVGHALSFTHEHRLTMIVVDGALA